MIIYNTPRKYFFISYIYKWLIDEKEVKQPLDDYPEPALRGDLRAAPKGDPALKLFLLK